MDCDLPEDDDEGKRRPEASEGDSDAAYLKTLVECEHHAIDQFDKTVLTLTGGAFAVSFAFLKDIVKPEAVTGQRWLICAWGFWCITLFLNLASFYCSHLAMRYAQRKFHRGVRREKNLQGLYGTIVRWLNPIAGLTFMTGLISMSVFVTTNLNYDRESKSRRTPPTATASTNTATPASTNPAAPASAKATPTPAP